MPSDKSIGSLLLLVGVVGILVYGGLLFLAEPAVSLLTLQVTAFIAVALILGIVAWIGYTMATTPPPEPLEVTEAPAPAEQPEPVAAEKPESEKKESSKHKK